ncbi:MAG: hypothetical protein ACI8P0_003330 [Planctomycetaceae bacterium]|jgi:hypothetical protein
MSHFRDKSISISEISPKNIIRRIHSDLSDPKYRFR